MASNTSTLFVVVVQFHSIYTSSIHETKHMVSQTLSQNVCVGGGGGGGGGVNVDALIHILCLTYTHIYTNSYIQMHLRVRSLSLPSYSCTHACMLIEQPKLYCKCVEN